MERKQSVFLSCSSGPTACTGAMIPKRIKTSSHTKQRQLPAEALLPEARPKWALRGAGLPNRSQLEWRKGPALFMRHLALVCQPSLRKWCRLRTGIAVTLVALSRQLVSAIRHRPSGEGLEGGIRRTF